MGHVPAAGYISDAARTTAEQKQALEDLRDGIAESFGNAAMSELTIAVGSVTPTQSGHSIDTEADAATDDLTHIDQTNMPDGAIVLIRCEDNARDVVVKHGSGGAGQLLLAGAVDLTLDDTTQWLLLQRFGTSWSEVLRSYGSNLTAFRAQLGLLSAAQRDMLDVAPTDITAVPDAGDLQVGTGVYAVTGGTAAVITLTLSPAMSALANGSMLRLKMTNAAGASATLNVNGIGAKKLYTTAGVQVTTGDYAANDLLVVLYNSSLDAAAGGWIIVNSVLPDSSNLVLLASASPSAAASVDITSAIVAGYKTFLLVFDNLVPATNDVELWLRTSTDNGATFDSGASDYAWVLSALAATPSATPLADSFDAKIVLCDTGVNEAVGNTTGNGISGRVWISNPLDAVIKARLQFESVHTNVGQLFTARGAGYRNSAADVDAVQLKFQAGTLSGEVRFYGLKEA